MTKSTQYGQTDGKTRFTDVRTIFTDGNTAFTDGKTSFMTAKVILTDGWTPARTDGQVVGRYGRSDERLGG